MQLHRLERHRNEGEELIGKEAVKPKRSASPTPPTCGSSARRTLSTCRCRPLGDRRLQPFSKSLLRAHGRVPFSSPSRRLNIPGHRRAHPSPRRAPSRHARRSRALPSTGASSPGSSRRCVARASTGTRARTRLARPRHPILEQMDATTVLEPGDRARSDADGNIIIDIGEA